MQQSIVNTSTSVKLVSIFSIAAVFIFSFIFAKLGVVPAHFYSTPLKHALLTYFHFSLVLIISLLLAQKISRLNWREMGFQFTQQNKNFRYWLAYGVLGNILVQFLLIAYWYMRHKFQVQYHVETIHPYFTVSWHELFTGYIFSPFFEEIFFRGILFTILSKMTGGKIALGASSLLFSGAHLLYGNAHCFQLYLGIMLGYCFLKTRSLFWPMILHAMANFFADGYSIIEQIFPGSMSKFFMW